MICDVPDKARLILDCVGGKGKTVKRIVLMEAFEADLVTRGQECGVEILSLKDFEVRMRIYFSSYLVSGGVKKTMPYCSPVDPFN